jgi:hypothetical protein
MVSRRTSPPSGGVIRATEIRVSVGFAEGLGSTAYLQAPVWANACEIVAHSHSKIAMRVVCPTFPPQRILTRLHNFPAIYPV